MTVELSFMIVTKADWKDIAVLDDGSSQIYFELGGNNGSPNTDGYLRYYSNYAGGAGANTDMLVTSSQYIADLKIHTSVLTIGSSIASSYFDGVFQANTSVVENKTFNRLVLAGYIIRGSSRSCSCKIYQVKLYNRALSAAEVQQNFNALRGRYGI
jgi:hypothetical protein